jgi:UDP-GlcNAc3NAcA epimerase
MKILTILGARPQFVKAATVSRAIAQHNAEHKGDKIEEMIIHTGQHFDANMSDIFFDQMDIPKPHKNLAFGSLSHGAMAGKMLEAIEVIINDEQPDWVLVYGDTNSTLAGSLAASKLQVPVAHVEAGLRSFNMAMPEEINRTLTDRVSSILFCPTQTAVDNLKKEGYPFGTPSGGEQKIINCGDVMYDATLYYKERAKAGIQLSAWRLEEKQYALCTIHRAENTDDPKRLESIFKALRVINKTCPVVLPIHPRTKNIIEKLGHQDWLDDFSVLEPQPYLETQRLEMGAEVILTDSGGMQKEAYFHGVPCVTLRDETEWVETVDMGWNKVVGADEGKILDAFEKRCLPTLKQQPYGDGFSADEIVRLLSTRS